MRAKVEHHWPSPEPFESTEPGGYLLWLRALVQATPIFPVYGLGNFGLKAAGTLAIALQLGYPAYNTYFDRRYMARVTERRGLTLETSGMLIDGGSWITLSLDRRCVIITRLDGVYVDVSFRDITDVRVDLEAKASYWNYIAFGQGRSFDLILVTRAEIRHRVRFAEPQVAEGWRQKISQALLAQTEEPMIGETTLADVVAVIGQGPFRRSLWQGWVTLRPDFVIAPGTEFLVVSQVSNDYAHSLSQHLARNGVYACVRFAAELTAIPAGSLMTPCPPPLLAPGAAWWPSGRPWFLLVCVLSPLVMVTLALPLVLSVEQSRGIAWVLVAVISLLYFGATLRPANQAIPRSLHRLQIPEDDILAWDLQQLIGGYASYFIPVRSASAVVLGDGKGHAMKLRLDEWQSIERDSSINSHRQRSLQILYGGGKSFRLRCIHQAHQEQLWGELHAFAVQEGVVLQSRNFEIVSLWMVDENRAPSVRDLRDWGFLASGQPDPERPLIAPLSLALAKEAQTAMASRGTQVEIRPARLDDPRPYLRGFGWVALICLLEERHQGAASDPPTRE